MAYIDVFNKNTALIEKLGEDKAHIVWVMARYLDEPDLEALAAAALTDGPNDKKIDFIYLDADTKRLVITQGYFATKQKDAAPDNKAADLNTAMAWFFSGDLKHVPDTIRETVQECRSALEKDDIESIELLYVHNLPESVNVARELQTAEGHVKKVIGSSSISVRATELGSTKIQHLYDAQDSHIEVKGTIEFPSQVAFEETGPKWKAYVASVPGSWLHTLYTKYGDELFSANYRGYLGGGRRRKVNAGIRDSAEGRPADFWAFNNGITMLTIAMKPGKDGKSHQLSGVSIINGAQTTGSIGSVDLTKRKLDDVRVLCRVIESSDAETIQEIVRFNNTQNAITGWDQYSNDPDQKRLVQEFKDLGFTYSIKRGFVGDGDEIGIDEVMQPLLAFHGRAQDAIRGRNQIFDRKPLYQNAFDGKKARHVLFVFSLAKAVDNHRLALKAKSDAGALIKVEENQLTLIRNLRFKAFFISMMAETIETAIGKKCDAQTIGFTPEAAKANSLVELTARWAPVVETLLALLTGNAETKQFATSLSDEGYLKSLSEKVNAMLQATEAAKKHAAFAELVAGT